MDEFLALRNRLMDVLRDASKEHPGKVGEGGELTLTFHYPGIYDDRSDCEDYVQIAANFILIGPKRFHLWADSTLHGVVQAAAKDIDRWIANYKAQTN